MQLFLSTNQTVLCTKLLDILRENPLKNPFAQDIILTQSFAMNQYLTLKVSDHLGISMGMQMFYPKTLVKILYDHLIEKETQTRTVNPWEIKTLRWIILKVLRKLHPQKKEREHFQLAEELSHIFNNYLLYRDFMLEQWESEHHEEKNNAQIWLWQREIWREIRKIFPNNAYLHHTQQTKKIIDLLQNNLDTKQKSTLKEICPRLFVFGISRTIPKYLDLWENLSQHIQVSVFALVYRQQINHSKIEGNIQKEQEKWFVETLKQKSEVENLPWKSTKTGFLPTLQRIYLGTASSQDKNGLIPDHSLMVRKCADKTREVEILRDILLMLFRSKNDKTAETQTKEILANDILVMAPNINDYTTLIRSIMERAGIPFSIADEKLEKENTFFQELLLLLSLLTPDNPWPIGQISTIIDSNYLAKKWNFYTERKEIIKWLTSARIKWGENDHGNSWQKGVERLLRGYYLWTGKERINKDENIKFSQPHFFFEGSNAEELGNFLYFLDTIKSFKKKLSFIAQQSLGQWCDTVQNIIHVFFDKNYQSREAESGKSSLQYLIQIFKKLHYIAAQEPFSSADQQKISLQTFLTIFQQELEAPLKERGFLTRGVTFSSLSPMRAIPFRVIYLLGMGEEDFLNKQQKESSVNLILAHPQPFDRSKKNEDRQLFFEAFLSAQEYFFLSYSETSQNHIKQNQPTNIFVELLWYAVDFVQKKEDLDLLESITYTAAAHCYDIENFTKITSKFSEKELLLRSPSGEDFQLAKNLLEKDLNPAEKEEHNVATETESFIQLNKKKILLQELINFFSNPIKKQMLFLGVNPPNPSQSTNEDLEPLYQNKFQDEEMIWGNYKSGELKKRLLSGNFFQEHQINWETIKKEGLLPFGYAGERELQEINENLNRIYDNALQEIPCLKDAQKETITHKMLLNSIAIEGYTDVWIDKEKNPLLIFCYYQKASHKELKLYMIISWIISSLFFFHSPRFNDKNKKSYLFTNKATWTLSHADSNLLKIYIDGFLKGKAIPLLPETAGILWEHEFNEKKTKIQDKKKDWFKEIKKNNEGIFSFYYKDLLEGKKSIDREWEKTKSAYQQFLQPFAKYCQRKIEKTRGKK